ncbi:hypothetical protein LBMAG42_14430 [Deltaproteobacteria bacterium]|nr:hypothetical protein LBMAG42_14430 [Deltaproteobacteria bacterium]
MEDARLAPAEEGGEETTGEGTGMAHWGARYLRPRGTASPANRRHPRPAKATGPGDSPMIPARLPAIRATHLWLAMLLFLLACESLAPTWIDQTPACDEEPYDWSDDLLSYVKSGPGDGSFDLDPLGEARTSIEGKYGTGDGSFAYRVSYGQDYWKLGAEVTDGVGTAWHNGDLDVEYLTTTTDRLDDESTTATRVLRQGCKQDWWTWNPDEDEPVYQAFSGTYDDGLFSWEAEYEGGSWVGTLAPDSTRTIDIETDLEQHHYVFAVDGTSEREFEIDDATYTYEGDEETAWNGDISRSYKIREDGDTVCSVEEEFDYDGDGTAHYECGGDDFDCEYSVKDNGDCSYECTNGDSGKC